MKIINPLLILLFLYSNAWSQEVSTKNTDIPDSTQSLILTINGKEYIVREKEKLTLKGSFSNPVITVRTPEYKKFNSGSLSFNYPKHMSVALSQSPGFKNWTFTGNDFIILYFEIDPKTPLDAITSEIVNKFGADNCKIEPIEKTIGGKLLSGQRVNITLAQQKLTQDFFQITMPDGKTRILAFQDSLSGTGHSTESKRAMEVIDASIKFN